MCDGCMVCDGSEYTIEVDADFLRMVHNALKNLSEQAPYYSAPGWIKTVEERMIAIEQKYKQPIRMMEGFMEKQ